MTYLTKDQRDAAEYIQAWALETAGRELGIFLRGMLLGALLFGTCGFLGGMWYVNAQINRGHLEKLSDHLLYLERNK